MRRSRVDGSVAADRGAGDEGARAERGDHHAAPLALEVRVGGDEEQRGELHADERVGGDELEGEQEREVDRRHDRVERALRVRGAQIASTATDHSTKTASTRPARPS